jgi:hypothetical protein
LAKSLKTRQNRSSVDELIHYIKGGRNFGPVSVRDFLELIDRGVLRPDDLVRVEGDGRWVPVAQVAERARAGRLTPPPPHPASKRPSAMPPGSHTVFTSAPPIPMAPVPRELATHSRHCGQCGTGVAEDAVFCKGCGMRLSRKACRSCGKSNDADARFCDQCGGRLDA